MAIGAGTIADVTPPESRGKVMAAWLYGPIFGPIVGAIGMDLCLLLCGLLG